MEQIHTKNLESDTDSPRFLAARLIKEIGRGKAGARSISRDDAYALYRAMLLLQVSDLEMGAILLAMRIKGESLDELSGFFDAARDLARERQELLAQPGQSEMAPILIPSYNGARKKSNLTALLALLLARAGAPVLIHGVKHDAGRVTTLEVFEALGELAANDTVQAQQKLAQQGYAVMDIAQLSPLMHQLLKMRQTLGVRNSTHTLVKLLQVFDAPAVRLCAYTHPEYRLLLDQYLREVPANLGVSLLMRANEGEVVANVARAQQIDAYYRGHSEMLREAESQLIGDVQALPEQIDAPTTAHWIRRVLNEELPVPINIQKQVDICLAVSKRLAQQS